MYTTLNQLKAHNACKNGYAKLVRHLGGVDKYGADKPIHISTILESNGLDDALWALRAVDGFEREKRLLACDFAAEVLPIFESAYPDDPRPRTAIETARRYAYGQVAIEELAAAGDAAWAAAGDAAWAAARAAARAAAGAAAGAAARKKQRATLLETLKTTEGNP